MFREPELCNRRGQKGLGSVISLSEPERASRMISSLCWVSEQETQRWFPRLQAHPGSLPQHMTPWAAAAAELCGVARSLGSECHLTIPAGTCCESCRDRKLSNRKLGSGCNDNSAVLLMTLEQRNAHCKPAPLPPPCEEHKSMWATVFAVSLFWEEPLGTWRETLLFPWISGSPFQCPLFFRNLRASFLTLNIEESPSSGLLEFWNGSQM